MMGKVGFLGTLLFLALLLAIVTSSHYATSVEYQTGSTTMNVTIRGYVSIGVSDCLTTGITFATQDPNTNDNNASCNTGGPDSGTGFNLTVDQSSTVSINFTYSSNRTNLTDGTYIINIANVTTHSNSTANNGTNLLDAVTSTALSTSWQGMETCGNLGDGTNCWITYFLDIPAVQPPGTYIVGYCWCGRQQGTDEVNCGTCTI
jgi:hypothetical protein